MRPVLRALGEKGHDVYVVSHFPEKEAAANYHEFILKQDDILTGTAAVEEVYAPRTFRIFYEEFHALMDEGIDACEAFFNSPYIQQLQQLNEQHQFDILITEYFNTDCVLGFAHKLGISKFIGMSSCALMPWHYDRVGLPDTPAYIPNEFVGYSDKMDLMERMVNWITVQGCKLGYRIFQQKDNERVKKYLGDGIPDLQDLAKQTKLLFVNQHFSLSGVKPFPPSVIEIGGIHINSKREKLPDDLQNILDNAQHGVIYVSWGSIITSRGMPDKTKMAIVNAFKRVPQTILWKWDEDEYTKSATNIHIRSWFPQIDILCHPNVVAFMSHGGMMGISEAVYCQKPTIITPIYGDQYLNGAAVENREMGIVLNYDELNEENVYKSIQEILKPSYKQQSEKVAQSYNNRPLSAIDTALFWTENVIENDGSLLKSQAAELSWYSYYCIDVILVLLCILLAVILLVIRIIKLTIFSFKLSKSNKNVNLVRKKKK
ncbi:UDP-glycosyltransferase UGT5-like isoform X2 [Chironomus tepperi]|uniref:UDP-glycosyltransferase UGT5-like isoform X2 n=1 Tax=Chironomus tepperi TaxID=113505 RepID=UPI00391EF3A2